MLASPEIWYGCPAGVDMHEDELVTRRMGGEEFRRLLGLKGFYHLSVEGLLRAIGRVGVDERVVSLYASHRGCVGCFTGEYPFGVCHGR